MFRRIVVNSAVRNDLVKGTGMSTDWFFIGRAGFFRRKKAIGPLSEPEVLSRIDAGVILPQTLMRSEKKTRDRWVEMKKVGPAFAHFQKLQEEKQGEAT
jgi:hypothetical protein